MTSDVICPKCKKVIGDGPVTTSLGFISVYSCKNCNYYGELPLSNKTKKLYLIITLIDVLVLFYLLTANVDLGNNTGAFFRNAQILFFVGLAGPAMLLKDYFTRKRLH